MHSIIAELERLYNAVGDMRAWQAQSATVHDRRSQARAADETVSAERLVAKHLGTATRIHSRLLAISEALDAARVALDAISRAVLVIDHELRLVVCNESARIMLRERDALAESAGGLVGRLPATTKALRETVRNSSAVPGALLLERRAPRPPLLATIVAEPAHADGARSAAVMFVKDPDQPPAAHPSVLSRLYGLTQAEARVAVRLMTGESIESAAESLAITASTARTHLKRILLKTDTNRQGQLIAVLLNGPAAGLRSIASPSS